jgi:hypothetical protein
VGRADAARRWSASARSGWPSRPRRTGGVRPVARRTGAGLVAIRPRRTAALRAARRVAWIRCRVPGAWATPHSASVRMIEVNSACTRLGSTPAAVRRRGGASGGGARGRGSCAVWRARGGPLCCPARPAASRRPSRRRRPRGRDRSGCAGTPAPCGRPSGREIRLGEVADEAVEDGWTPAGSHGEPDWNEIAALAELSDDATLLTECVDVLRDARPSDYVTRDRDRLSSWRDERGNAVGALAANPRTSRSELTRLPVCWSRERSRLEPQAVNDRID